MQVAGSAGQIRIFAQVGMYKQMRQHVWTPDSGACVIHQNCADTSQGPATVVTGDRNLEIPKDLNRVTL